MNMTNYNKDIENEINLVDLKDDVEETTAVFTAVADAGTDDGMGESILDFCKLKLIENPIGELSNDALPQTLRGCVGYLQGLPLLQPNANQSKPETIVDMVNSVLPLPSGSERSNRGSDTALLPTKKKTIHSRAPGSLGHTVRPGCISMYKKYDIIYAVPEGRWWLLDPLATWIPGCKNRSLDTDLIRTDGNQVLIIRIIEGQVGLITIQGVHHLLDVGTHVFNTGTVQVSTSVFLDSD